MERLAEFDYKTSVTGAKKETSTEIAKNLLNMGLSIEETSKATGLPLSEIERLKKI